MANRRPKIIAEFINEYEEKTVVHRDRKGCLRVKRNRECPAAALSRSVGMFVGQRVREFRKERGLSLAGLARKAGLTPTKQRMREIEVGGGSGLRTGTIYALAWALNVEIADLLPSLHVALEAANAKETRPAELRIA